MASLGAVQVDISHEKERSLQAAVAESVTSGSSDSLTQLRGDDDEHGDRHKFLADANQKVESFAPGMVCPRCLNNA